MQNEPNHKDIINDFVDDIKKNTIFIGIRTTLENELKISNTEALNYLMGFPFNFGLESFVTKLFDVLLDVIKRLFQDDIEKNKFLTLKETLEADTDSGHVARLKSSFDKKKLIEQNFESATHIDVQEFLAWAANNGFIKINNKKR